MPNTIAPSHAVMESKGASNKHARLPAGGCAERPSNRTIGQGMESKYSARHFRKCLGPRFAS